VAGSGEPHVAPHVSDDATYYENPDLPETRSEIAVPMRDQGRLIGVLDIQQTSPGAFGSGDLVAVQALGDLVAAMHRNGRLVRQLQQSMAAERRAYAELSAQAWLERARTTEEIGFRYEGGAVRRLAGARTREEVHAEDVGTPPLGQVWPLSIRGRSAGVVKARKAADQGGWTDAELEFVETVIEQLSPALESARLHEDTESRAARDRLLADVAAHTRETLELDTVLSTAADDIYAALGLAEVVIHLVPPSREEAMPGERD
jgi:GAF domain-containing protein